MGQADPQIPWWRRVSNEVGTPWKTPSGERLFVNEVRKGAIPPLDMLFFESETKKGVRVVYQTMDAHALGWRREDDPKPEDFCAGRAEVGGFTLRLWRRHDGSFHFQAPLNPEEQRVWTDVAIAMVRLYHKDSSLPIVSSVSNDGRTVTIDKPRRIGAKAP